MGADWIGEWISGMLAKYVGDVPIGQVILHPGPEGGPVGGEYLPLVQPVAVLAEAEAIKLLDAFKSVSSIVISDTLMVLDATISGIVVWGMAISFKGLRKL